MSKENYHERKAARIARFEELAAKNKDLSDKAFDQSSKLANQIPLGQPILVGHHSEKSHRRHIKKIHNQMDKSVEADKKAKYYQDKAQSAESNNSISSDNPDALEELRAKLASLERYQEIMKEGNKVLRSTKLSEVEKIDWCVSKGFTEAKAMELLHPKWDYYKPGWQSFKLTNNGATIRATKERIAKLEKLSTLETKETVINGIEIVEDVEDNRVKIMFPSKPSEEVRARLKSNGFRWSPKNGAWQRHYSNTAIYLAREIIGSI